MIDNKRLGLLMAEWKEARADYEYAQERGMVREYPTLPQEAVLAWIELAERTGNRKNFRGYGFLDDMRGDALLTCLRYAHNFDPSKGTFGTYFTRIIWNAFVKRINKEGREREKVQKVRELVELFGLVGIEPEDLGEAA